MNSANFHEKAHFVKADMAAALWLTQLLLSALRAMLPSALSVSPLSLVARCIMRSVFIRTNRVLQSSERSLLIRVDQVRNCAVTLKIRSASGNESRGLCHFRVASELCQ